MTLTTLRGPSDRMTDAPSRTAPRSTEVPPRAAATRGSGPRPSDALIFFGAGGDLVYKQSFPALPAPVAEKGSDVPVIGVTREGWARDQLLERAEDSLTVHGGGLPPGTWDQPSRLPDYMDGDYRDPGTFTTLRQRVDGATASLVYPTIPPDLFPTVVEAPAASDLADGARPTGLPPLP